MLLVFDSIYSLSNQPQPLPHDLSADLIPTWSEEYVNIHVFTSARTARCGTCS